MSEQTNLPAPATFPSAAFLVRSFQATDRQEVLRLHAVVPMDSVDCDCETGIDRIEEVYLSRPQDHFWVADVHGRIVGTVAMCMRGQDIAHVLCLRAIDDSTDHLVRRGLVQVAADRARQHGCLKLVLHSQADVGISAQFLNRIGFRFSRKREIQQRPILEFYLNLYEPPEWGALKAPVSQRQPGARAAEVSWHMHGK